MSTDYTLADSGDGRKLERFGPYLVDRPSAGAVWRPRLAPAEWDAADAMFSRDHGNRWSFRNRIPSTWILKIDGLTFRVGPTDFGHLGVFPEHARIWAWIRERTAAGASAEPGAAPRVLNLFGYSGGVTLAALTAGGSVCHVDASRAMVARARDNSALNGLGRDAARWIIDDARKFLAREERRGTRYDAIVLDPPSFGHGTRQEIFKIDRDLPKLLDSCRRLLSEQALGLMLTCHTPGYTPLLTANLMREATEGMNGDIASGELLLTGGKGTFDLPSGVFAGWTPGER